MCGLREKGRSRGGEGGREKGERGRERCMGKRRS